MISESEPDLIPDSHPKQIQSRKAPRKLIRPSRHIGSSQNIDCQKVTQRHGSISAWIHYLVYQCQSPAEVTQEDINTHATTLLPEGSPTWAKDTMALWSVIGQAAKSKYDTVAKDIYVPALLSLNPIQFRGFVSEYSQIVADTCSLPVTSIINLIRGRPFAHLFIPLRTINMDGWGAVANCWSTKRESYITQRRLQEVWMDLIKTTPKP